MSKQDELIRQYEKNIRYLQDNIPPDDIYIFAEQTLMAAEYFVREWMQHVNILQVMNDSELANKYINNIMGFIVSQYANEPVKLNLSLKNDGTLNFIDEE